MEKKDYFSKQSGAYAAFRPSYPRELYEFIFQHLEGRSTAWDCATGNGQVAQYLAQYFKQVFATDISQTQLNNAFQADNIVYSVAAAEKTTFQDRQFDLITVAQALHWFNLPEFYREVRRTAKPNGLLAVWGYGLLTIEPAIDDLFLDFYNNRIGAYWDDARKHVEDHYRNLPFPFKEIPAPGFEIRVQWSFAQFTGYLSSWSATQKYIEVLGQDLVESFTRELRHVWPEADVKPVCFPVFLKCARIASA